ncbi:MAG: Rid family hydrolase [Planctomycetota bacterium]
MAQTFEKPESVFSPRAAEPVGPYPHAKRVGNLIFVSGIGPRKRGQSAIPGVTLDTFGKVVTHSIDEQCRSAFDNVRMILEDAGSSWENIVDVTVFLTHLQADWAAYNRVYSEYFKNQQPARTTVEVTCLPTPIAVEIKVIAVANG